LNQVGAIQKVLETTIFVSPCSMDSYPLSIFYFTKMAKEIQLTKGQFAIVDDEMYDYLNQWKWFANNHNGKFYVVRNITVSNNKQNKIYMHRLILKPEKNMVIDHLNGDGLDNRKCNLRICTHAENMRNSKISINNKSGYKGVSYQENRNNYRAQIKFNNKTINIGDFIDPIDAARAYNDAALKYHGEFANINKID